MKKKIIKNYSQLPDQIALQEKNKCLLGKEKFHLYMCVHGDITRHENGPQVIQPNPL